MGRLHRRDLCPTRAYVQKHFSDVNMVSGLAANPVKEKLFTIRENANEGTDIFK